MVLFSCKKEKAKEEQITLYNLNDFYKKIKIEDTACINQTKRAKEDIKNGKYSYNSLHYEGSNPDSAKFLNDEDFKNLGITIDTKANVRGCIRMRADNLFSISCYEDIMADALKEKYGSILDSIAVARGKEYANKHPDEVYEMNISDFTDYGLASDHSAKVTNQVTFNRVEFENQFIYPKNYMPHNEENYSHTSAEFILLKNGTIKNLKVEAYLFNDANKKYKKYFEAKFAEYIKQAKWISPHYYGQTVNCTVDFTFFHK